ncbi:hypothetical protein [Tumebacillus permanentifrigoris]|uniref:Uncharacterized protein n=1 Tax=Tumebacillus permanentifrigoris TaxID=378543 RepID=A0A316DAF5_9BACL|nr:hypothetical protein [Tumebacillus permanentifrigoris]PWK14249.1 hypothetical protein C7459_1052 [Tumebacillus permanentifrigoris]
MKKHAAVVRHVIDTSYLVLVNGLPVHHTTNPSVAEAMVGHLQRFFAETDPREELIVTVEEGGRS